MNNLELRVNKINNWHKSDSVMSLGDENTDNFRLVVSKEPVWAPVGLQATICPL